MPAPHEVSELLFAWSNGNEAARDELIPLVYSELHRLAKKYLNRERLGHTLQPTALVHEALHTPRPTESSRLEEQGAFLRCRGATDAPDPGGSRAAESSGEARGWRMAHDTGRVRLVFR